MVWGPKDEAVKCLVMSPAEILAGKILALLDRSAARDLFDLARLPPRFRKVLSDTNSRKIFVALSGTLPHPLTRYGRSRLDRLTQREVEQSLYPLLRTNHRPTASQLRAEAWYVIEPWMTLSAPEIEYVERLQQGDFQPELLFKANGRIINRLRAHPVLQWKVSNAQMHARRNRSD